MRIIKFKKIGSDKYKVIFENNELILYEDVILKYNLLSKSNIKVDELNNILEDNKHYEIYNLAIKFISVKMRSKKEIEAYLIKKECDEKLINEIVSKLESNGLINELIYLEAYINDSVNLKNIGPYKIKEELIKLGFDEDLIDKYLRTINPDVWNGKISKYINKLKNSHKNYSNNILKQKILNDLYIKGFDKELIYPFLESIDIDDLVNIKYEYEKAYKKYSNKYKNKDLENKIITYLKTKGYEYKEIFEIVKNKI